MTEHEWLRSLGTLHFRVLYNTWQTLRFAEDGRRKFGERFVEAVSDSVEVADDGSLVSTARPSRGEEIERLSARGAGIMLAERLLAKGLDPDEVRRQALGKWRTFSRAATGSPFDKAGRMKEFRRGVRKALRLNGRSRP